MRESDVRVRIRTCAGWPPTVASDGGMTTGGWMGGWVVWVGVVNKWVGVGGDGEFGRARVFSSSRPVVGRIGRYLFFLPAISGSKENNIIPSHALTCYCHRRIENEIARRNISNRRGGGNPREFITCSGLLTEGV